MGGISEDLEGDGIGVGLSVNILPSMALSASYSTGSGDVTSFGTTTSGDVEATSVGILFHAPINDTTDFVAGIDIIRGKVDLEVSGMFFSSKDADGNSIFLGLRSMVAPQVELSSNIYRTKIEADTNTDIEIGASYYIDMLVSFNISYELNIDSSNSTLLSVTKYF